MRKHVLWCVLLVLAVFSMNGYGAESGGLNPEEIAEEQELRQLYPEYYQAQKGIFNHGHAELGLDYRHAGKKALEKWQDWKYGLRIHWGVYSILGVEASTSLYGAPEAYEKLYHTLYQVFNPTDFDADEWMEMMKRGGMKYFTFTTKHADGFCMWPTKVKQTSLESYWLRKRTNEESFNYTQVVNNYSIMDSLYKKDIVRMIVDAARRHGLGIGLYYNHFNWNDYNYGWSKYNYHYDENFTRESDPNRWQAFIQMERDQLTELLTMYGDVDLLSLDMHWPKAAQEEAYESARLCRKLQPHLLMRHRGIGPYGDYSTPERWVPKSKKDVKAGKPWQVIYPCGGGFAWLRKDTYKPGSWILSSLIDIVSKGGNFQVAFGPMANGKWDPEQIKRIEYVGDWLKVNGEAIYKSRTWYTFFEGDDIRFTRTKDWKYVYAICLKWPGEKLHLTKVKACPNSLITMLGHKNLFGMPNSLKWHQDEKGLVIEIPSELQEESKRPCKQAWVFRIKNPETEK